MNRFWKSWRSKFGSNSTATVIDGLNDGKAIADRFASVFQEASVPNSLQRHRELEAQFSCRHTHYVGDDFNDIALDDVAVLVERRTVKFVDRLIDSNNYRKLFLYVRPSFCSF